MDFSNRRYSKPKVLKKRKDLNKYKLKNGTKDRSRENTQGIVPVTVGKPGRSKTSATAGPGLISKINRSDRLTVNRGLFPKCQKSKVACRGPEHRSEQSARLHEDLDAIIPSGQDGQSPHKYEENNNLPTPLSPAVEVIWGSQPDSDQKPLPPPTSPAHKSTLSNHSRAKVSRAPRQSRSSRSRSLLTDLGSPYSVDPYPRTRAYVNAQRERLRNNRSKALDLSSDSETDECETESSPGSTHHKHISKYIELVNFAEKKFVRVKQEIFKGAPCNDYFKKLRKELWDSYQSCGKESQEDRGDATNSSPVRARTSTVETTHGDKHTDSNASSGTQTSRPCSLDREQREFVFSPNLSKSPLHQHLPHENRSEGPHAHHFLDHATSSYDDTGWRARDFTAQHSHVPDNYYSNHPSSNVHSSTYRFPRDPSPDLSTFGHYEMRYHSDLNPHTADYRNGYRCRDSEGSYVQSPNSRLRDGLDHRDGYQSSRPNISTSAITIQIDDEESPPMKFYPRKLF